MPCFTNFTIQTRTMWSTKTSEVKIMKDYITNTLIQYKLISHHRQTCGLGNDGGNDGGWGTTGGNNGGGQTTGGNDGGEGQ